jgi:TP901 family phage tail tape measure protein
MADGSIEIDINGNSSGFDDAVAALPDKVKASTIAFGDILADLGKKAVSSLSGVVDSAMETGKAFENSMSNVSALQLAAGATADDIALLKQASEDFGASTQFTMAQCADALGFMALAGWDAEKSVSALPGVLSLAAASNMELAAASDMVTDYMSAFSKSVSDYTGEALTAAEFSDKLAYAQANSNTNVAQLGEAFKNCAANMNAAGQQMDTVTALLGTMANQGLKGAESGTVLTAVVRDINNKMKDGAISINGTSVAVSDANGNYRDMIDIMADVEKAVDGMGETERSAALSAVFTADSIKGMNLVLNAGTESVRQLEAGISQCEGAADEMAKTLNDNLTGDLTYLESALDAVKNSIYEGINEPLRKLVQSVTSDVAPELNNLVDALFAVASGAEDAGEKLQSSVSALASWFTKQLSSILPVIVNALGAVLGELVLAIVENTPAMFSACSEMFFQAANAASELAPKLLTALADVIAQVIRQIIVSIPDLVSAGMNFFQGLTDALLSLNLADTFSGLLSTFVGRLMTAAPLFAQAAEALFQSVFDSLPDMFSEISKAFQTILPAIDRLGSLMIPIGMNLIESLVNGLLSALPEFLNFSGKLQQTLTKILMKLIPMAAETGIQILETLVSALLSNLPEIAVSAGQMIFMLAESLIQNTALLADTAVSLISSLIQMISQNAGMLAGTAAEIITVLIDSIAENLPTLLTSALEIVLMLISGMIENLPVLVQAAVRIVNVLVSSLIENAVLLIDAAANLIFTLAEMILENLPVLITAAVEIVFMLADMLIQNAALLADAAVNLILMLVNIILDNLDIVLDAALKIILAVADGLISSLPKLLESAVRIVVSVISGILEALPKLQSAALQIIGTLVQFLSQNYDRIIRAGIELLLSLIGGIIRTIPDLVSAVPKIISTIWDMIMSTDWSDLGINILKGLADGLIAGLSVVWDTIQSVGDAITDGFKSFFGIHSPSRLFRDEIGKMLLPGISVGVDSSVSGTTEEINQALDNLISSINFDDLQMKLNTAVQIQGYSAIAPPETQKAFRDTFREPERMVSSEALESAEQEKIVINAVFMLDGEVLAEGMAELVDREQGVTIALSRRGINR